MTTATMTRHPRLRCPEAARAAARRRHRACPWVEYEDLEQEACLRLLEADLEGSYDPRRSSLATFSTVCATRRLLDYVEYCGRHSPEGDSLDQPLASCGDDAGGWEGVGTLGDSLEDGGPSPEQHAVFAELVRQLPDDARAVARLVLGDAAAYAGLSRRAARAAAGEALGWPARRLREAYAAIERALAPQGA